MNKIITAILLFAGLLIINSCSPSKKFTTEDNESVIDFELPKFNNSIRVLLSESVSSLSLKFNTSIVILENDNKINIQAGKLIDITSENKKLKINANNNQYTCSNLEIQSSERNQLLDYRHRNYYGNFFIKYYEGRILLINILELDNYLKGVIPSEMPLGNGHNYNEALKAFTICARTYALSKLNNKNNFDVYSDVRDQVYRGNLRENDLTDKIIDETRDMILTYKNKPAIIYYSSTCGGRTEDAQNVFSEKHIPYLISQIDGEPANCSISPRFIWEVSFSKQEILEKLVDANLIKNKNVSLIDLRIINRFPSGRINELQIIYSENGDRETNFYLWK